MNSLNRSNFPGAGVTGSILSGLVILSLTLIAGNAVGATFVINNINAPGVGFNDTTPVAAVAGNPATTIGAQRLAAFQAAADTWGALLISPVDIIVSAQMTSLNCSQNSATLGSAGAAGILRGFAGAPNAQIWYPVALANSLAGSDLDAGNPDINANFNQDIGQPGCLQALPWSYVIGAAVPGNSISFFDTVIHEIGHGLGVFSLVNTSTGALANNRSDSYTEYLLDETPIPAAWTSLNNAGRVASAIDTGNLTWTGPSVTAVAGLLTAGRHGTSNRVRMFAPNPLQQGSSVSHFDTALTPNEIMEPSLTSVNRGRLANHLMLDLGWRARVSLAITKTDGLANINAGSATSYTITVQNNSVSDLTALNIGITDTMPAALQNVSWSCAGLAGGTCSSANGMGNINSMVAIPQGGTVVFDVVATISNGFTGNLANTASLALPANLQNLLSNSSTDNTLVNPPSMQPGFTVSGISNHTTEAGLTATFNVVLNTQPSDPVSLDLSSSDTTEGVLSTSNLNFTTGNWATPQVVTVTGQDDDVDDGDVDFSIITATASSPDSNYQGKNPIDVQLTNLDDDTAGFTVSAISGNTSEAGQTATFSVRLNSEPTATVNIGLSSNDLSEGIISQPNLSFATGDWATPQVVTVTGQNDDIDDGDVNYSIITSAAASSDAKYNGLNPANVSVINSNDDTAGITVSPASGDTNESGQTATFSINLDSEPTGNVAIGLSSNDTSEGTITQPILNFTTGNWSVPQLVTVTGQDDDIDDGDVVYSIISAAAISSDAKYSSVNPNDVSLNNLDDDTVGITVSLASGDTSEAGQTASFSIQLDSEPTATVTIGLTSSDTSEGSITQPSLNFTTINWSTPQLVTVTGQDDDIDDGDVAYSIITAAATSSDSKYSAFNSDDIALTNLDNDTAGIAVSLISGNTSETGISATFTIELDSEPTADVTIDLSSSNPDEGLVAPAGVTFTPAAWFEAKLLTVTGQDDLIKDGNVNYSIITAPAVSADSNYSGIDAADVDVTNVDNESEIIFINGFESPP